VITDVDRKVIDEPLNGFRRAPGSSEQTIEICSQHRARVVQRKKRIKSDFLKLPLTCDTTFATLLSAVRGVFEVALQMSRVVRIFVGGERGVGVYHLFQFTKKRAPTHPALIASRAIFLASNVRKQPLRGHPRDLKRKDFSRFHVHRKRNTQRLAFGVFTRLKVIKLNIPEFFLRGKGLLPIAVSAPGLLS